MSAQRKLWLIFYFILIMGSYILWYIGDNFFIRMKKDSREEDYTEDRRQRIEEKTELLLDLKISELRNPQGGKNK